VAIATLLLWMCTAAVGGYLLVTSTRVGGAGQRHDPGAPVPASQPAPPSQPVRTPAQAAPGTAQAAPGTAQAATPPRARDRFDPPSLARAKSEPLPGMRELAEFTHPALAIIGLGFWLSYVLSRDRVFAAIGSGVLLGAIAAGVSWAIVNARAAKRAADGGPAAAGPYAGALSFSPRLLVLHAAGAVLTLLIAVVIAARA
jgi:hypothetical protein